MDEQINVRDTGELMQRVLYEVKRVVVGQDHFLERVLVAMLAQGHLLVEGVPGLAKTLTVNTLARTIRGTFKRIQFTPDLLPADLVGTRMYNQRSGDFSTVLGPVFTNLLLADEINRAPAKVQSALLEVMQERQVTIAGDSHKRTRAVPGDGHSEPDRDRGYLSAARSAGRPLHDEGADRLSERRRGICHRRARHWGARGSLGSLCTTGQLAGLQQHCRSIYVDPALDPVCGEAGIGSTRRPDRYGLGDLARYITFGASPRATINLIEGARALAFLRARSLCVAGGRRRSGARRACDTDWCSAMKHCPTVRQPTH
jgi:MoxR-like ATPase